MPLNRKDLVAACRANDEAVEAGGSVPAVLMALGVDPMSAVFVAEQRALRTALFQSGIDLNKLMEALQRGEAVAIQGSLKRRERDLIPVYAGAWTDGLLTGVRAVHTAFAS